MGRVTRFGRPALIRRDRNNKRPGDGGPNEKKRRKKRSRAAGRQHQPRCVTTQRQTRAPPISASATAESIE